MIQSNPKPPIIVRALLWIVDDHPWTSKFLCMLLAALVIAFVPAWIASWLSSALHSDWRWMLTGPLLSIALPFFLIGYYGQHPSITPLKFHKVNLYFGPFAMILGNFLMWEMRKIAKLHHASASYANRIVWISLGISLLVFLVARQIRKAMNAHAEAFSVSAIQDNRH